MKHLYHYYCYLFFNFLIISLPLKAQDTTWVQTFTYGSPQDAWFVFPKDTVQYSKILMYYKLKCNPNQNPACGEWDYLTYTYLYDHTGKLDSTLIQAPSFIANGTSPSKLPYITEPSYTYIFDWQYHINYTDTISYNAATIGNDNQNINFVAGCSQPQSRSQYVWLAEELLAQGLLPNTLISGIQWYVQQIGSPLNNLTIRMRTTSQDSMSTANLLNTGLNTVYRKNTIFTETGYNSLAFTTPFLWNGTSNLIVDISYDNAESGTDNILNGSILNYSCGVYNNNTDYCFNFNDEDYINVPVNKLSTLDSFVTVCFWQYGNPELQPQDGTSFEAIDASGNRILNAHNPWSDSNVYWDAGSNGSYDRINKTATNSIIEGSWNNWAFVKNCKTGSMKIYLNGTLWHSGTNKTKLINGIHTFRIGKGNWNGSQTFKGYIDEFAVFNKDLDATTIKNYFRNDIDQNHPYYQNLIAYYKANDNSYSIASDASTNPLNASLLGVSNPRIPAIQKVKNFKTTPLRPNIIFEQGVFTTSLDSTLVVLAIKNDPIQVLLFNNTLNPLLATDTQYIWQPYNKLTFNNLGDTINTIAIQATDTLTLSYHPYYKKFELINRYELGRYITPYGIGLDLGQGWTWTYDLSDYRSLLADSVHLSAGNWQELLDVKFAMIKGKPARQVVSIQNLWNGAFSYGVSSDPIDTHLQPITLSLPPNTLSSRFISRVTGHGFGGTLNCAEFCAKKHSLNVDGTKRWEQLVWRDNCDQNPLFPQGGTWVYHRANWCPGAEVETYEFELSPYISSDEPFTLDYNVEPYSWNNTGSVPTYVTETQLINYGNPNFTLDAEIYEVKAPSNNQMYNKFNSTCSNPVLTLRNGGSIPLTSVEILYGIEGNQTSSFTWHGNLAFTQKTEITLPKFDWNGTGNKFVIYLLNPNNSTDENIKNNQASTNYIAPPSFPETIIIETKTNNKPEENSYSIINEDGNIIKTKTFEQANTIYKDTLQLTNGCYTLKFIDQDADNIGDGLSWWANNDSNYPDYETDNGYFKIKRLNNSLLKNYETDFGKLIQQPFTVGLYTQTPTILPSKLHLYIAPNPANNNALISFELPYTSTVTIRVFNTMGKQISNTSFTNVQNGEVNLLTQNLPTGTYFVQLISNNEQLTRKLIKIK